MSATRTVGKLVFECPSPSIWQLVGGPVMLAYDGKVWVVSMCDRDGTFREGRYASRARALDLVALAYAQVG
jgi:hypothetical protein